MSDCRCRVATDDVAEVMCAEADPSELDEKIRTASTAKAVRRGKSASVSTTYIKPRAYLQTVAWTSAFETNPFSHAASHFRFPVAV